MAGARLLRPARSTSLGEIHIYIYMVVWVQYGFTKMAYTLYASHYAVLAVCFIPGSSSGGRSGSRETRVERDADVTFTSSVSAASTLITSCDRELCW